MQGPPLVPVAPIPPQFIVAIVGTVSWAIVSIVLGLPFVRAWARRFEQRHAPPLSQDVSARLARIEQAVESIAIEVERISESQRYLAKLQTDRKTLETGGSAPGPSPR